MSTYQDRKRAAERAEMAVERWLRDRHHEYHKSSAEAHNPRAATDAVAAAQRLNPDLAPLLAWVRYAPDYHVCDCRSRQDRQRDPQHRRPCFIEAKASAHVERDAWLHYLDRDKIEPVYVVALLPDETAMRKAKVRDVVFVQADWQPGTSNGSGTPYRTIDWSKTPHTAIPVEEIEAAPSK